MSVAEKIGSSKADFAEAIGVDPKVYDLACHFLADVDGATDIDRRELAVQIQETIEFFMSGYEAGE